jgi:cytochrome c5
MRFRDLNWPPIIIMALVLLAVLVLMVDMASASNCNHFFRRQQVVHRHHAVNYGHALNQAVYGHHAQPLILYLVGQQKVQDANIRKIVDDELAKRQQVAAPQVQQAVTKAPQPAGTDTVSRLELVKVKCGKCHSGGGSQAPEKFDIEKGVRLSSFMNFTKFAGREEYRSLVPAGMEGVMSKLSPEDLGPIMEFMQDLPILPEPAENESPESGELQ